jgi:hypothetical protein
MISKVPFIALNYGIVAFTIHEKNIQSEWGEIHLRHII